MAISASNIVSVVPRILTGTGSDLVFNGMVFSKDSHLPVNTPIPFYSSSDIADYFGDTSDEYEFASVYFSGYQNSQIKPSTLYFFRHCEEAVAPFVRGATLVPADALAALKQIVSGNFAVTLSGTEYSVNNIDLSSVTSLSEAAQTVQTALRAEGSTEELTSLTVAFDAVNNKFTVTNGKTGEEVSVKCPSGTIATAMGFDEDTCTISLGSEAQTLTATINTLTKSFQNFVTYTTIWEASDEEALTLAKWASTNASNGTCYLYVLWDSSEANLDANNTKIIVEQLKEQNIGGTAVVYPSYKVAAFVMGTAASIAWDNTNSTITFAFKSQDGLGADVNTTADANALDDHGVNYVGDFATRNDNFVMFYNGQMLGSWQWIDTYLNSIWLCNALQVQIMTGFKSVRRAPYNERGYSMVRSWCRDVINRAITNGVIDAGVTLNETQKSALIEELGADYSNEIYSNGYYLQVQDATANTRQQRKSPPCNLVYTYGGAIQRLTLPAIAVV